MTTEVKLSPHENFLNVKPGDIVQRVMAEEIPMRLEVELVTENLIVTKGGWTFDRQTGIEEDPEIGWGIKFGITGSRLVKGD